MRELLAGMAPKKEPSTGFVRKRTGVSRYLHRLDVISGTYGLDPGERLLFIATSVATVALIIYGSITYLPPYLQKLWGEFVG